MDGQMKANLRFVKCPRCRQILPELPDIPVYKCGGCETILQAKHRKTRTGKEPCASETAENCKVQLDHIPERKKNSSLNQATIPSEGGSSAEASTSRSSENGSERLRDCSTKQPGDKGFSGELRFSSELSCHEHELGEQMEEHKHIGKLNQDTGKDKHEFGDCGSRWHRARSFSDDFPSSMELTCHEMEDSSPELESHMLLYKDTHAFDQCTRVDETEHGDCKLKHDKGTNFYNKVSATEDKHEENDMSSVVGSPGEEFKRANLSIPDCAGIEYKFSENADRSRENLSSCVTDCNEHQQPSGIVEIKKGVDEDSKDHTADSLKVENTLEKNENENVPVDATEAPTDGRVLVDNTTSLGNQHLELSQSGTPRGLDRESSVDSFDRLPFDGPSSEAGTKRAEFLKSSMTRRYYAYDGSASSSDGNEDHIPGHSQFSKPPRRKFKHSAFTNSNGLHRQDEARVKDFLKNKSEMHYQGIHGSGSHDVLPNESEIQQAARKSLILEEKSCYDMKYRQKKLDELPDSRSYGHPGRSRIKVDKEEHASSFSYIPGHFPGGRRFGTPSNYQHSVFQPYSGFFPPDIPSYSEPDKKELLRMVYELKEELSRTHISKNRYSAGFSGEEAHAPLCYSHLAPAEDIGTDLHYSRYPGRSSQATGLRQPHKISRMAFSGDGADYRHQVDCSCLRGCPQDWHWFAQLPSHMMCRNKVHRMGHTGHTCYKGSYSESSSPQHYTSSWFSLYGRETKSDDQGLRDSEMNRHVREKHYSSKRYLMPVAGAIPIVACYHCSELLQLPADFLLFGRKYHRLRCNACEKVMKFSLESGTHLSRNVRDDAIAPPPSMVDDFHEATEQRDWAGKSPHAEPISCSDDYGLSFDRSCSTEGEPSMMMPSLKPPERNTQNRKTLSGSGSSFQPVEDRKMKSIMREPQETTLKSSKENFGSEGPSSKISKWGKPSSEIEELPQTSGSPLHRLMGYLSASEVIKP